jgi:hypothetical protein
LVGSSEAKKVPGLVRFLCEFFIAFFNSLHQETPKNVIKTNREKKSLLDFLSISRQDKAKGELG